MDLDEALYKAIVGPKGRKQATEGRSVASMIAEVEAFMGGAERTRGTRAAAASQTPARTWRAWRAGRNPTVEGLSRLKTAQRRARLSLPREAWLRGTPAIVVIAEVDISTDRDVRVLRPSTWTDSRERPPQNPLRGMVARTLDKWLIRHDISAGDTFMAPIHEHIGQEVVLVDVHEIRFFRTEQEATRWLRNR